MDQSQLLAHCGTNKITREELNLIPTPEGTPTHHPLAHYSVVEALLESLAFRHISVVRDEYAVSEDGMKMFGVLDLETAFEGCRFSIGIRNSNDKSMRLAMTVGYRVSSSATTWRSRETSVLSSRNIRSDSASLMRFQSEWTACSVILSRCDAR